MAKKTIFHEFDPVIYPLKIWVSICPHYTQVTRKLYGVNKYSEVVEFTQESLRDDGDTIATTFTAASKKDNQGGAYIHIFKPHRVGTRTIAHEAAHCADLFAEKLGLKTGNFSDGEAYAYLIGWIAECIENAVKSSRAAKKKKKK